MAGVRSGMPTDDPSIPASKVVANYDSNNNVVSYTLVDRNTNQATMIMEPLDYAAYRNSSPGTQALMKLSPQYALDFASAGLYSSQGDNGRAVEHFLAGITSRDYVRDVAFGIVGAAVSATTVARPAATVGAKGGVIVAEDVTVTSGGTANSATGARLADDLAAAQTKDSRIGTTLPGANAPVTVTAESNIGGRTLVDTNQTARPSALADPNKPTLISDLVPPGKPNSNMANAHAEVGLVQQAYDAGLTQGQSMTIVVRGEAVCTYCQQSTNLIAAANRAGLNSLQVVDTVAGRTYLWIRGSSGWK
jgi:hypothetical protein